MHWCICKLASIVKFNLFAFEQSKIFFFILIFFGTRSWLWINFIYVNLMLDQMFLVISHFRYVNRSYFKWITNIWFIIRFTSPKLNSKSGSRSKISQMKVFLHPNAYKLNLTIEATYIYINPFSKIRCISHQKSYHLTRSSFDDRSLFLRVLFSIIWNIRICVKII